VVNRRGERKRNAATPTLSEKKRGGEEESASFLQGDHWGRGKRKGRKGEKYDVRPPESFREGVGGGDEPRSSLFFYQRTDKKKRKKRSHCKRRGTSLSFTTWATGRRKEKSWLLTSQRGMCCLGRRKEKRGRLPVKVEKGTNGPTLFLFPPA